MVGTGELYFVLPHGSVWRPEWIEMNEWKEYIARLKANNCMLNLPHLDLAEN